jgi:acetyl esterase/lipase
MFRTVAYGASADHVGDLYLPDRGQAHRSGSDPAPVICLLHGGFWRLPYGRDHIAPIAVDLAARGFAVWNLEYRRVGAAGGGWPGTFEDVGAGIDHLATLTADGAPLDLGRITAVGHSAGGHLALWCAARQRGHWQPRRVTMAAAVGLAAVSDLGLAYALGCGNGAVGNFMGGSPLEVAARYQTGSPSEMLPLGTRQLLIHGTHDEDVPIDLSRRYAAAARAAGDDLHFMELDAATHMDFVDPLSAAHAALCQWLERELEVDGDAALGIARV